MKEIKLIGIYGILIDNKVVYVGKSKNIFKRIRAEGSHIKRIGNDKEQCRKYELLRAAQDEGHKIAFTIIELCSEEKIDERKDFYLLALKPILNSSLPNGVYKDIRNYTLTDLLKN